MNPGDFATGTTNNVPLFEPQGGELVQRHPDTRYANRAERRAAGYVRRCIPVGGVIVRKEID